MTSSLQKISDFLEPDSLLDVSGIVEREDAENQIIELFDRDQDLFKQFLYRVIDRRIRDALVIRRPNQGNFEDSTPVAAVLLIKDLANDLRVLAGRSKLMFPTLRYTLFAQIIQTGLVLLPIIAIGYFFVSNLIVAFLILLVLILLFYFFGIGWLILIIGIPAGILLFPFRRVLEPSKLDPDIKSYRDFVKDVVLTNRVAFANDNYALTREEIRKVVAG